MGKKNKQNAENDKQAEETWRKPLQVPPRTNAMRSFYQGAGEEPSQAVRQENQATALPEKDVSPAKVEQKDSFQSSPKKQRGEKVKKVEKVKDDSADNLPAPQNSESAPKSTAKQTNKLTAEDLSRHLGFEIADLFDIHELLRGKSFDIYQALLQSRDEKGRCKITQPELMKRTGIKNRRTFYKHEERLINLRLLEKRSLPGDHKGVVYRVFEMSDVLPVSRAMLEQFAARLKDSE